MRDYEGFADPASPKNALLVECGQHWEAASALIAIHSALRFLLVNGVVDADWASQGLAGLDLPEQRFVEVTRSEEHTSQLPSLMRISYAVFCFTKKTNSSVFFIVLNNHIFMS